jgi:hypothetical protein
VLGLYAGGGFLSPQGQFGSGAISCGVRAASQRLNRATPGFTDLLGTATLSGRFGAAEDEELAKAMSGKFELLVSGLPATKMEEEPKPAGVKKPEKGKAAPKKDEKNGSESGKTQK